MSLLYTCWRSKWWISPLTHFLTLKVAVTSDTLDLKPGSRYGETIRGVMRQDNMKTYEYFYESTGNICWTVFICRPHFPPYHKHTGKCIYFSTCLQTPFFWPWVRWSWRRQWWGREKSSPAVTGGLWCQRPEPPAVTSAPIRKSARSHSGLQLKGDTQDWLILSEQEINL